jgi:hypothetical protein
MQLLDRIVLAALSWRLRKLPALSNLVVETAVLIDREYRRGLKACGELVERSDAIFRRRAIARFVAAGNHEDNENEVN